MTAPFEAGAFGDVKMPMLGPKGAVGRWFCLIFCCISSVFCVFFWRETDQQIPEKESDPAGVGSWTDLKL